MAGRQSPCAPSTASRTSNKPSMRPRLPSRRRLFSAGTVNSSTPGSEPRAAQRAAISAGRAAPRSSLPSRRAPGQQHGESPSSLRTAHGRHRSATAPPPRARRQGAPLRSRGAIFSKSGGSAPPSAGLHPAFSRDGWLVAAPRTVLGAEPPVSCFCSGWRLPLQSGGCLQSCPGCPGRRLAAPHSAPPPTVSARHDPHTTVSPRLAGRGRGSRPRRRETFLFCDFTAQKFRFKILLAQPCSGIDVTGFHFKRNVSFIPRGRRGQNSV